MIQSIELRTRRFKRSTGVTEMKLSIIKDASEMNEKQRYCRDHGRRGATNGASNIAASCLNFFFSGHSRGRPTALDKPVSLAMLRALTFFLFLQQSIIRDWHFGNGICSYK